MDWNSEGIFYLKCVLCRMFTNSNSCFAELSRDLSIHSTGSSGVFHGDIFVATGRAEKDETQEVEQGRRAVGILER